MKRMISPSRAGDLLEHRLEPVLELAAVLGPGHQGAQVQGDHPLVLQPLGHVAVHDALGQALHDGGLAHARLADEHRVVLGAAGQHLDDPADLLVPADDRVELAPAGQVGEVAAEALQRLVAPLRLRVGDPLRAPHLRQRLEHALAGDAVGLEDDRRVPLLLPGHRQQQVLGGDVGVLHGVGFRQRRVQQAAQPVRYVDLAARPVYPGQLLQGLLRFVRHDLRVGAELVHEGGHGAALLAQQGQEEVLHLHLLLVELARDALGVHQRLLCFYRQLIRFDHDVSSSRVRSCVLTFVT